MFLKYRTFSPPILNFPKNKVKVAHEIHLSATIFNIQRKVINILSLKEMWKWINSTIRSQYSEDVKFYCFTPHINFMTPPLFHPEHLLSLENGRTKCIGKWTSLRVTVLIDRERVLRCTKCILVLLGWKLIYVIIFVWKNQVRNGTQQLVP